MWIVEGFVVCAPDNAPAARLELLGSLRIVEDLLCLAVGLVIHLDDQAERREEKVREETKAVEVAGKLCTVGNS